MNNRLFCFGFGYTANAFARRIINAGWKVAGATRDEAKAKAISQAGFEPVLWDGATVNADALQHASALLISTPPNEDGCPALNAARDTIIENKSTLKWIGYLSTNGVYGDHKGQWVDEESALNGTSPAF